MSGGKKTEANQNIQVFVRVRPMNVRESEKDPLSVVDTPGTREVVVRERSVANITKTFTFDRVFGQRSSQVDVYKSVVAPLVNEVLYGYNCTVFAYGQTGTGKTFTMEGDRTPQVPGRGPVPIGNDPLVGILPRALSQVFDEVRKMNCEYTIRVSFLELYNEELFDLLGTVEEGKTKQLRLYEDTSRKGSVVIQGLEEVIVKSKHEVYAVLERGSQQRKTAATLLNAVSSRSHTIFTITVHMKETRVEGEEMMKIGKLNLVDLAGSENIGKSGAVEKRAREAGSINQSLLTLGRVITALVERTPHVPYRESKLTRLLQDSLGGKTKTSIIATVSPSSMNIEETLSTLDYAHRAKNIMNKPELNQRLTKTEALSMYNGEIDRLRKDLIAARERNGVFMDKENYAQMQLTMDSQCQELNEKSSIITELQEVIAMRDAELSQRSAEITDLKEEAEMTSQIMADLKQRHTKLQTHLSNLTCRNEELSHLLKCHVNTESNLQKEAETLLKTTTDTVSVIDALQSRLERKKNVEERNWKNGQRFRGDLHKSLSDICDVLNELRTLHSVFSADVIKRIDQRTEEQRDTIENFYKKFNKVQISVAAVEKRIEELSKTFVLRLDSTCNAESGFIRGSYNHNKARNGETKEALTGLIAAIKTQLGTIKSEIPKLKNETAKQFSVMEAKVVTALQSDVGSMEKIEVVLSDLKSKLIGITEDVSTYTRCLDLKQSHFKENYKKKISILQETLQELFDDAESYTGTSEEASNDLKGKMNRFRIDSGAVIEDGEQTVKLAKAIPEKMIGSFETIRQDCVTQQGTSLDKLHVKLDESIQSMRAVEKKANETHKQLDVSMCDMTVRTEKFLEERVVEAKLYLDGMQDYLKTQAMDCITSKICIQNLTSDVTTQERDTLLEISDSIGHHCDAVSEATQFVIRDVQQSAGSVDEFWESTYAKDIPTGVTPMKKSYDYPTKFSATSPHERVLARYRAVSHDVQAAIDEERSELDSNDGSIPEVSECTDSTNNTIKYLNGTGGKELNEDTIQIKKNNKNNIKKNSSDDVNGNQSSTETSGGENLNGTASSAERHSSSSTPTNKRKGRKNARKTTKKR